MTDLTRTETTTMTKKNLSAVSRAISDLQGMRATLEVLGGALRDLADAEQETFDNRSEAWQESERGQQHAANAEALSNAADYAEEGEVGSCLDALENIALD